MLGDPDGPVRCKESLCGEKIKRLKVIHSSSYQLSDRLQNAWELHTVNILPFQQDESAYMVKNFAAPFEALCKIGSYIQSI